MALNVYVMPLWRYLAGDYERAHCGADVGAGALTVSPAEARAFVARLRHGFRDVSRNEERASHPAMKLHRRSARLLPFLSGLSGNMSDMSGIFEVW